MSKTSQEKNAGMNNTREGKTTRPIDSPEKVQSSNDEKIDQDFPGYPHHPASDVTKKDPTNNQSEE